MGRKSRFKDCGVFGPAIYKDVSKVVDTQSMYFRQTYAENVN